MSSDSISTNLKKTFETKLIIFFWFINLGINWIYELISIKWAKCLTPRANNVCQNPLPQLIERILTLYINSIFCFQVYLSPFVLFSSKFRVLKTANVLFACMGNFKFYDFMVSAVTFYKYTDLSIEEIKIMFSWKRKFKVCQQPNCYF